MGSFDLLRPSWPAARRLHQLLADPERIAALGRQANTLARTHFNRENEMRRLVEAYGALADKG